MKKDSEDHRGRLRLTSSEFINLFKEIATRPEIYFLLVRYIEMSVCLSVRLSFSFCIILDVSAVLMLSSPGIMKSSNLRQQLFNHQSISFPVIINGGDVSVTDDL